MAPLSANISRSCIFALLASLAPVLSTPPAGAREPSHDYFELSLEQLADLHVTTVAGVAGARFRAPAAIHVITSEDLRRSGHTHLAEALRTVPGLHVGRLDASNWGTGVRGFADTFSPYLQVLVDGRVVYNELFGGVYWDVQSPLLEDIDRIEVIRGPGATLWGANAVNGVINVITKSAAQTQGGYLAGGGGSEERGFVAGRYGAKRGKTSGRIWGRYFQLDGSVRPNGKQRRDDWSLFRGGVRLDGDVDERTSWMLQAEGYDAPRLRQITTTPSGPTPERAGSGIARGGHALLRVERRRSESAGSHGVSLQLYYDVEHRENSADFRSERDTVDLDLQHQWQLDFGVRHEGIWGGNYRYRGTDTEPQANIAVVPANRETHLVAGFVQDTLHLVEDRVFLMLGSKFEHNSFTGFEAQPSVRLWWTPTPQHTLWGAFSRPVRIPDIIRNDIVSVIGFPTGPVPLRGPGDLDATRLLAYELGFRWKPLAALLFDVAGFYFDYDRLIGILPSTPSGSFEFSNAGTAEAYGIEILGDWRVRDGLRIVASYSWLRVDSRNTGLSPIGDRSPEHQFKLQTYVDLTSELEFNAAFYYIDDIPQQTRGASFEDVGAYFRLDLGLTWRPTSCVEVSVWGQNLVEEHAELNTVSADGTARVERGVYARVEWSF